MNREDYIKAKIAEQGHTIKSFAAKIDMPYSTLLSILKGSIGGAAVDNAIKICKGIGITISELQSLVEPTPMVAQMPSFNEDETKVLSLYKELSSHDQGRVLGYIEQLHDNMLAKEKIKIAARDGSFTETTITNDDIENINNLPDVDDI